MSVGCGRRAVGVGRLSLPSCVEVGLGLSDDDAGLALAVDVLLDDHDFVVLSLSLLLSKQGHLSPALGSRKHGANTAEEEKEGERPP